VDLAHLVRARGLALLRSPILHIVLIGVVIFAGVRWLDGAPEAVATTAAPARPEIAIPRSRLAQAREAFTQEQLRAPSAAEAQAILDALIDQEVLFQYAMEHGMQQDPVVRRRLAQIARFVQADGGGSADDGALAAEAVELGLHRGDLVVRRILSDAARRLIRSVVLLSDPPQADVLAYYEAHPDLWTRPAETRLTHVAIDGWKHGDATEALARERLALIRAGGLDMEAALALGDEPAVPSVLPFETDQALARRFGTHFTEALRDAPAGDWSGPLPSRDGQELVYVHERRPPRVAPFVEVEQGVRQRYLQGLADEWLRLRLQELRSAYDISPPTVAD